MARKNRRVLLFVLLLVLGTGMASYFLRGQILTSVAEYLIVSDPLQKADAIEVLSYHIIISRLFDTLAERNIPSEYCNPEPDQRD